MPKETTPDNGPPLMTEKGWPCVPYKGFSYYGPGDIPIFAGRDREIIEFAEFVGDSETRLVLLQGATGCGKSSFLRAGIIPFIEGARRGFEFRKSGTDDQPSKAIFIRSTDLPLQRLAEEVFKLGCEGYQFDSPIGEETINLSGTLQGHKTAEEFAVALADKPEMLVDVLRAISSEIPSTLVLVIDQGEEALSLTRDDRTKAQSSYFEFLNLFALSDFPLKLIVSLRTDYFGLFLNEISRSKISNPRLRHYLLANLEEPGLIAAIRRPTLSERQGDYPPPPYAFSFEQGLPETIASDLIRKAKAGGLPGGELPVMQVVCETLYTRTRGRGKPWVITYEDYAALGDIEIQLNDYVDRFLVIFCSLKKFTPHRMVLDVSHWKDALWRLVRVQANNALTTDIKTLEDLTDSVDGTAKEHFEEVLDYLSQDSVGVLRAEQVRRIQSTEAVRSYSLRHDAVGLVLKRWKEAREARQTAVSVLPVLSGSAGLIYVLTGIASVMLALYSLYAEYSFEALSAFSAGIVALLIGSAFIAWSRRDSSSISSQVFAYETFLSLSNNWVFMRALKADDKERLSSLHENPLFRLLIQTDPDANTRFQDLKQRSASDAQKMASMA